MEYKLDRFINAQREYFENAKQELLDGHKESHWMWFIFPQLKGLGKSSMSEEYGLDGIGEAKAYYRNTILHNGLIELCNILLKLDTDNPEDIFSDIDARKLKSSMTIFSLATDDEIFDNVLKKYFSGEFDTLTLKLLHIN